MPIRLRAAAVTLLPILTLAACAPNTSESAAPSSTSSAAGSLSAPTAAGLPGAPSADDYHPTTGEIEAAAPGQIIKQVELRATAGTRAWFVVYGSTGLDGRPVAVSGLVVAPEAAPPSEAGYPVVAWAHGTTGIADSCAPSANGVGGLQPQIRNLVAKGYVVTATDYEGLGTDGVHPYLIGTSEGRSVLDSIRAVGALPNAHVGQEAVVIGLSQGGHAALWAAQLKPTYAPELPLLGALAASPPTDMAAWETWAYEQTAAGVVGPAAAPILLFGVWNAIYDVPLGFLTDAGRQAAIGGVDRCDPDLPSGGPYASDPAQIGEWRALLVGNSPGAVSTEVPILVISPESDQFVGYDTQIAGVMTMCAIGDTVELKTVSGDHLASMVPTAAWAEVESWITDRFAGVAGVSTCGATAPSATP